MFRCIWVLWASLLVTAKIRFQCHSDFTRFNLFLLLWRGFGSKGKYYLGIQHFLHILLHYSIRRKTWLLLSMNDYLFIFSRSSKEILSWLFHWIYQVVLLFVSTSLCIEIHQTWCSIHDQVNFRLTIIFFGQ